MTDTATPEPRRELSAGSRPDPNDPNRRRRPRDAARKLEVLIRREQVSTLMLTRTSYRQMASLLGVSKSQIEADVKAIRKGWQERASETFDRFVTEQVAELDGLMRAWMPLALNPGSADGDGGQVDNAAKAALVVHRLLERRSRLLGLDAPVRAELTGEAGGPIRFEGVDAARAEAQRALSEFEQRRAQQLSAGGAGDVIDVDGVETNGQGEV